jgi:hypothetical protein
MHQLWESTVARTSGANSEECDSEGVDKRKLGTLKGWPNYEKCMKIREPTFGQMTQTRAFGSSCLRDLNDLSVELYLIFLGNHVSKLFGSTSRSTKV